MRIEIFDVGHGHCTVLTAPNGRRMMLDCGQRWDDRTFWTPSLRYFNQTIDLLALLNLDEDHVRDFDSVMRNCTVPWVLSNPTIGPSEFAVGAPPCSGLTASVVRGGPRSEGRPRCVSITRIDSPTAAASSTARSKCPTAISALGRG